MSERRKALRCAIYTRKSSEEGLEQDFNSLDAQREACEAFVASQKAEGWSVVRDRYDDGGFSGGTLDRPALQRLLTDIENQRVDVIVVYKIDRLSRSLMDFAKLVEVFDRRGVTFVSVTQQFNTTTSMGRLTLNILLSFAQFEREVTGERIRDKIAASKKKGMWMGGLVPIGYQAADRTLIIKESEAELVRTIFRLYLDLGSVPAVETELRRRGVTSPQKVSASGRVWGGRTIGRGHLYHLLSNRIYLGEIPHKETSYPGNHPALIDQATWDAVHAQLGQNMQGERTRRNAKEPSLLSGLLFDQSGRSFQASHAVKGPRRYRYYVTKADGQGAEYGSSLRFAANEIEPMVIRQIIGLLGETARLMDSLAVGKPSTDTLKRMIATAESIVAKLAGDQKREALVQLVERVTIGNDRLVIKLRRRTLSTELGLENVTDVSSDEPLLVESPLRVARRGAEARFIIAGGEPTPTRSPDPSLVRAVARGYAWFEELTSGRAPSIKAIADREGVTDRYIKRLLDLAFLPPRLVENILDGKQPPDMTLEKLGKSSLSWQ